MSGGLPDTGSLALMVNNNNVHMWQFLEGLGVPPSHLHKPLRSLVQSGSAAEPITGTCSNGRRPLFRMFMCSVLYFLGLLSWILQWKSRVLSLVRASFLILQQLDNVLPGAFTIYLGDGIWLPVHGRHMDSGSVLVVLAYVGRAASWHDLGIELPRLDAVRHVPFHCVLFAVMRASNSGVAAMRVCKTWISAIAKMVDASSWGGTLSSELPAIRLPRDCDSAFNVQAAARGDDKFLVTVNRFLVRRTGYSRSEDILFQDLRGDGRGREV